MGYKYRTALKWIPMASSLLALIDDIATLLDDVALLSKVAAQKTTGVLGDDLALNAQQVAGVAAERELPVVWAVGKGSARNKAILVPAALAISAWAPWAVTPLLMVGGAYLCFEGFEKLAHKFMHSPAEDEAEHQRIADSTQDLVALERDKIAGAIRTDFVLSAEIIAITLGTVADAVFLTQLLVLSGIAVVMTIGVYGLVAGIVKLDDAGFYLARQRNAWIQRIGRMLVAAAPWLMKGLAIAGTIAMFLVGGGILVHGLPFMHGADPALAAVLGPLSGLAGLLVNGLLGLLAGALCLVGVTAVKRLLRRPAAQA
jgi:predicted DNA repair protein MutK